MTMKILPWMLCLLSSGAMAQTYDYQGNLMTGTGGVETLTASLTFLQPITNPNALINLSVDMSGSAFNHGLTCELCSVGESGGEVDRTFVAVNAPHGVFTSAVVDINVTSGTLGRQEPNVIVLAIGPKGDSLQLESAPGDVTFLSVSNDTPGTWKEITVPELDPSVALGAITLLGAFALILEGRRRAGKRLKMGD